MPPMPAAYHTSRLLMRLKTILCLMRAYHPSLTIHITHTMPSPLHVSVALYLRYHRYQMMCARRRCLIDGLTWRLSKLERTQSPQHGLAVRALYPPSPLTFIISSCVAPPIMRSKTQPP